MKTVLNIVAGEYSGALWIGLWKTETSIWHWSLADKAFYKMGENNYWELIWDSVLNTFNCGLFRTGQVSTVSCGVNYQPVCFDGESFVCAALSPTNVDIPICTLTSNIPCIQNTCKTDILNIKITMRRLLVVPSEWV